MARRQQHMIPDFSVYMFKEDIDRIRSWVLQYPDLETGGSLFGLWTSGRNPVVQIVLGPGVGCTRTEICFFQNVDYLRQVGELLTQKYMLCHIGEWHSHHSMRLYKPSDGDVSTVVRNYPEGACGFLLMIVNITSPNDVKISPYMFRQRTSSYLTGKISQLDGDSPFRSIEKIERYIDMGAEQVRPPSPRPSGIVENIKTTFASAKNVVCTAAINIFGTKEQETPMEIEHVEGKRQRERSRSPDKRTTRGSFRAQRGTSERERRPQAADHNTRDPRPPVAVGASTRANKLQWYSTNEGEKKLKEIFESISRIPETRNVEMRRDATSQDLSITFVHHSKMWLIDFPFKFPSDVAHLKQETDNIVSGAPSMKYICMISESAVSGVETQIRDKITSNCAWCRSGPRMGRAGTGRR